MSVDAIDSPQGRTCVMSFVENVPEESLLQRSLISATVFLKRSFLWLASRHQNDMAAVVNRVVSKWSQGVQEESQRSREEDSRHHDKKREYRRDERRKEIIKEEISRQAARLRLSRH